jgi:hypothetical protein
MTDPRPSEPRAQGFDDPTRDIRLPRPSGSPPLVVRPEWSSYAGEPAASELTAPDVAVPDVAVPTPSSTETPSEAMLPSQAGTPSEKPPLLTDQPTD